MSVVIIKQLLSSFALKAVIYAIKKWILKIPNWAVPEEVRQFFLRYLPTLQKIAQGTSIEWDDNLTEKLSTLAANRMAFNVIYTTAVEAWHAAKNVLPETDKEEREGIIRRILSRRRNELADAVAGTPVEFESAAELTTAIVSFLNFAR